MRVLVTGVNGFIGRRLTAALQAEHMTVVGCARQRARFATLFPQLPFEQADFAVDHAPERWLSRLAGVDAVVNAVGIFRERGSQTFDAIHVRAPRALFDACLRAGVRRVIQVSALGADARACSRFLASKKAADDYLASLDLNWTVVQPSLVYGPRGTSAHFFNMLAALPVTPLPGDGDQHIQPVHLDDVVAAIVTLVKNDTGHRLRIPLVGPDPLTLRDYLARLRAALGLTPAPFVSLPLPLVRGAARVGEFLPGALLTREALDMLLCGNVADATTITALIGRAPRPVAHFIAPGTAESARREARLAWLLPLMSASIALVWIVSGVVSLGIYPVEQSYALLARVGIGAALAPPMLYGAATLDLAIGIGILVLRRRRWLWQFQIALILAYSAIIAGALPELWLHPFGPLIKNVPMLAGIALLLVLEK